LPISVKSGDIGAPRLSKNEVPRSLPELMLIQELQEILPKHSKEEWQAIEESLLNEGFWAHERILTWHGIVIDGCLRYVLCKLHGIPFHPHELSFANLEEAKIWRVRRHLGRRNLSEYLRKKLTRTLAELRSIGSPS